MSRGDTLLFELKRGWAAYLAIASILGFIVIFSMRNVWLDAAHGQKETARIVQIGLAPESKYDSQVVMVVVAKDSDGLIGRNLAAPSKVRGCGLGDNIEAERVGSYLKLNPKPCS